MGGRAIIGMTSLVLVVGLLVNRFGRCFDKRPFSCCCRDRLDLRRAEERSSIAHSVALAAVDKVNREKRLAAVPDLISSIPPACPRFDLFCDPGGLLGLLDPLRVDRLCLFCRPRSVQRLSEADLQLAEDGPRAGHDRFQIVPHLYVPPICFVGPGRVCVGNRSGYLRKRFPVPIELKRWRRLACSVSLIGITSMSAALCGWFRAASLVPCDINIALFAQIYNSQNKQYLRK